METESYPNALLKKNVGLFVFAPPGKRILISP